MHKISKIISPFFMRDRMTEKLVPYNTRSTTKVEKDGSGSFRCSKKSNYEIPGTKTVSYSPNILKLIPDELKELESLDLFKLKVKSLKCENCFCKLCKNYTRSMG